MKPYHEELSSKLWSIWQNHYSPKYFLLKTVSNYLLDHYLAGSRILYFWQVLEPINKFFIELHVLKCLLVRGSNKKQRRGRIISNFTKGQTFCLLRQPNSLGGNLTMWPLFLHPPKKLFLYPSVWPWREYTWKTQFKGELTDLFWKLPAGYSLFP